MVHLMQLDEHDPAVRGCVVPVALLEALRVAPPHALRRVPRARESPRQLVASLVEAASSRTIRVHGVAAGHRKDDQILVVRVAHRRPAERSVWVLAAYPDVEARSLTARALRVHRATRLVVDERLRRSRRRRPARMRLDLARRTSPRTPDGEDDVDRVDPVLERRRTILVGIRSARVEVREASTRAGAEDDHRSREDDGEEAHGPRVRAPTLRRVSTPCQLRASSRTRPAETRHAAWSPQKGPRERREPGTV